MALAPKLEIRQSQSLVMTPQLMQAIKLLQLSALDLIAYVEAELERNPLLEHGQEEDKTIGAANREEITQGEEENNNENWLQTDLNVGSDSIAHQLDTDVDNIFPDDDITIIRKQNEEIVPSLSMPLTNIYSTVSGEDFNLENFIQHEATLHEYLNEQLATSRLAQKERMIGYHIINGIDDNGYFKDDLEAIAKRLGGEMAMVEAVLNVIQTFDPSGIGGRDLAECLAIQLREKNRFDPAMETLIQHLDLLAKRDLAQLQRLCGVDNEDLRDMIMEIRDLNPRPGNIFTTTPVQTIVPDVFVRTGPDGGWIVELNPEALPKVLINQTYYAEVSLHAQGKDDKAYIADCLQNANWLTKSLDQRARTILKVSSEILRQQDAFFVHGIQYLKPLNLKTVADAIDMHESTISRVTSNKYMATNQGIFEFKYFFTSAISAADGGEAHSAEAVRYKIKHLIDAEDIKQILSDDTIVKHLKEEGIDIARRTVAKYRETMHIPSSVERRREKNMSIL